MGRLKFEKREKTQLYLPESLKSKRRDCFIPTEFNCPNLEEGKAQKGSEEKKT